jgi:hypothetical protein
MEIKPYRIDYEFRLSDEDIKIFKILLHPINITLIHLTPQIEPQWAQLDHQKCACCPLDSKRIRYCPIAVNIAELVDEFKNMVSSDNCLVRCRTPERTYVKKTSIMAGLSSILGIIMATSDCPIMEFLKPMARFHLPFATVEETMVRSISIYLLRQYFVHKNNIAPDLDLKELDSHYEKVRQVNRGLLARIKSVVQHDADMNAIFILHSISESLCMEIDYNLDSLSYLFTTTPLNGRAIVSI